MIDDDNPVTNVTTDVHGTTPGALVGWYNIPAGTTYGDPVVTATDTTSIAKVFATFGGVSKALTLAVPAV